MELAFVLVHSQSQSLSQQQSQSQRTQQQQQFESFELVSSENSAEATR